jgi:hypothetical protein
MAARAHATCCRGRFALGWFDMDRRKLQSLINKTVKGQNAFHTAQAALNDYCREIYDCEPGEIDADSIIDSVLGGCGMAHGMSADEFDAIMIELKSRTD